MLKLNNINFTLNKNTNSENIIFKNLNLEVKEGEFVIIIGKNGAGKSTLFNIISGDLKIDSGEIFINEENIETMRKKQKLNSISKVFQDPNIGTIGDMTIFENMAFAFRKNEFRGLNFFFNKSRENFFKEKLQILNMNFENRLNEKVKDLSGGQKQILSFTMSILKQTKILLLDEVTSALDPKNSELAISIFLEIIKKEKLTCLMITHDLNQIKKYGDRLFLLENNNLREIHDRSILDI